MFGENLTGFNKDKLLKQNKTKTFILKCQIKAYLKEGNTCVLLEELKY